MLPLRQSLHIGAIVTRESLQGSVVGHNACESCWSWTFLLVFPCDLFAWILRYTLDFIKWTFLMVKACESSFLLLVNQSLGPVTQLLQIGLCSCKTIAAALGHFQPLLGWKCSSTGLWGTPVQFALPLSLSRFVLQRRPVVAFCIIYCSIV